MEKLMKSLKFKLLAPLIVIVFLFVLLIIYVSGNYSKPINIGSDKNLKSNLLFNPFSGWVKLTKKGGGPNGFRYEYIKETPTYCNIRYQYSGYARVATLNKHYSNKLLYPYDNLVKAVHQANKQISLGKLSGFQIMPTTHIRVKWRASSNDTLYGDCEILAW